MSSISVFGVGISTIIFIALTFISQFLKTSKKLPSPPGKTGWPIIGETLAYVSNPRKFVQERMAKHSSEIFTTSLAGEKMVVFCGPTANKCVFANEGRLFNFWLPGSVTAILSQPNLNSDTPTGKPSHELFMKFLKADFIQRYVPVVDTMVQEHLDAHWVSKDQVKVHGLAKEYMLATCLRVLVNNSNPCQEEVNKLREPLMLSLQGIFSAPINLPGTAYSKAMTGSRLVQERVVDIIRQRRLTISDDQDDHCQDLLGMMILDAVKNGKVLSDVEIAKRITGLIFAGFYPTSTTITFAIAYLAEHPEIYELVLQEQQEIASSKGPREPLTWMDVQKMQYSWNVICETMRLKPPIPGNFRTVMADFTYAGYQILKGCKAYWTPFSTHTDPKYFHDPESFDPSRFEKSVPAPYTYVPFGAGSRMCVGKDFARILTLVFLHNVVTRFRFEKVNPNEKIIFNPDPIPSEGLGVYLRPHVKYE